MIPFYTFLPSSSSFIPCIWNFCFDENTIERIPKLIWELLSNNISFGNSLRKETKENIHIRNSILVNWMKNNSSLFLILLECIAYISIGFPCYSIRNIHDFFFHYLLYYYTLFLLPCHPFTTDTTANDEYKLKSCKGYRFSIKSIGLFYPFKKSRLSFFMKRAQQKICELFF